MSSGLYNTGAEALATGTDWTSADVRVLLVTSAYTPDPDDEWVSDLAGELSGGNYVRETLDTRATSVDAVNDRVELDAADTAWSSLQAAAGTPAYAIVYVEGASDAARKLLGWVALTGSAVPTGGSYTVQWPADGLFWLTFTDPPAGAVWAPLDFSGGVESDPNGYGSVVGDADGLVTFTVAAGLGTTGLTAIVGSTTGRPLAIDIPAPTDWDPATEDLWLQLEPVDVDLGSGKRLGLALALVHSGTGVNGGGIYESSTSNLAALLTGNGGTAASTGVTVLPDRVKLLHHFLQHNGLLRGPAWVVYETDGGSTSSGTVGSSTGSTALSLAASAYTIRAYLLHGSTAVAGGEVISGRMSYARVKRPA